MTSEFSNVVARGTHQNIVEKAASWLTLRFDGNGLQPGQISVADHEMLVHLLPGNVAITLKPEVSTTRLKGSAPRGEVLGSAQQARDKIAAASVAFLKSQAVMNDLQEAINRDAGDGWGMPEKKITLPQTAKDFCVIEICVKCNGSGGIACDDCHMHGHVACPLCFGSGMHAGPDGREAACARCRGHRQVPCARCGGNGRVPCLDCDASGHWTDIFRMVCVADLLFTFERKDIPPEVLEIVDHFGARELALEEHAEISRMPFEIDGPLLRVPLAADLPIAEADFVIAGKKHRAVVVGQHGHIVQMDPVMDPYVKPGINALLRLSKGPMATGALMETACKYRMVRETLAAAAAKSRKMAYAQIFKEYDPLISEKYAKAAVRCAAEAIVTLGAKPRALGLALGTGAAGLLSAGYFFGGLRPRLALMGKAGEHMQAPDIAVWLLGYGLGVLIIMAVVGHALKKALPPGVIPKEKKLLPPGNHAWYALGATLVVWLVLATAAKAEWLLPLLAKFGRH